VSNKKKKTLKVKRHLYLTNIMKFNFLFHKCSVQLLNNAMLSTHEFCSPLIPKLSVFLMFLCNVSALSPNATNLSGRS